MSVIRFFPRDWLVEKKRLRSKSRRPSGSLQSFHSLSPGVKMNGASNPLKVSGASRNLESVHEEVPDLKSPSWMTNFEWEGVHVRPGPPEEGLLVGGVAGVPDEADLEG